MGILRPLRGRSMALLWGGLSLSAVGDQLYAVALTWIAVGYWARTPAIWVRCRPLSLCWRYCSLASGLTGGSSCAA